MLDDSMLARSGAHARKAASWLAKTLAGGLLLAGSAIAVEYEFVQANPGDEVKGQLPERAAVPINNPPGLKFVQPLLPFGQNTSAKSSRMARRQLLPALASGDLVVRGDLYRTAISTSTVFPPQLVTASTRRS
ncbi:MAG: hypothetical protein IPK97_12655 [Ahniella sp.]|nr:hypothetical protein [Ahniella sp.]